MVTLRKLRKTSSGIRISLNDILNNDNQNTPKIPKEVFRNFLNVATKQSLFMFNSKFYKQIDGVAMGSPFGPALANHFYVQF